MPPAPNQIFNTTAALGVERLVIVAHFCEQLGMNPAQAPNYAENIIPAMRSDPARLAALEPDPHFQDIFRQYQTQKTAAASAVFMPIQPHINHQAARRLLAEKDNYRTRAMALIPPLAKPVRGTPEISYAFRRLMERGEMDSAPLRLLVFRAGQPDVDMRAPDGRGRTAREMATSYKWPEIVSAPVIPARP